MFFKNNFLNFFFYNFLNLTFCSPTCFYINVIDFSFLQESLFEENFELSFFFDLIFTGIFQYYGLITILLIFFFLGKNLFLYSFHYYLTQFALSFKFNNKYSARNTYVDVFLAIFISRKPINIIYRIADNMLISTLLVLLLVFYNTYSLGFAQLFFIENVHTELPFPYINNFNLLRWISYLFDFVYFGFIIDNLSLLMVVIVLSISTLVHYYSIDYMYYDP
jgi:hypothetical protein